MRDSSRNLHCRKISNRKPYSCCRARVKSTDWLRRTRHRGSGHKPHYYYMNRNSCGEKSEKFHRKHSTVQAQYGPSTKDLATTHKPHHESIGVRGKLLEISPGTLNCSRPVPNVPRIRLFVCFTTGASPRVMVHRSILSPGTIF